MKRIFVIAAILLGFLANGMAAETNEVLWVAPIGYACDASPAIADDGTVYITSSNGKLYAFTSGGKQKWSFQTKSDIKSSPAIGTDGTVYFGGRDKNFYAITPEGKEKWHFKAGLWIDSSPAIAEDGTILFGSWDHCFYALDSKGNQKWKYSTGGPIDSSPSIATDGTIYVGSHDHKFYAFRPDGTVKWSFEAKDSIISSPAIAPDGTVYFTSVDGNLYALNSDGSQKWKFHSGGTLASSPVLDKEGVIYVGVNHYFFSIKPDGTKLADFQNDDCNGSPVVTEDGAVLFGSQQGTLYTFESRLQLRSYCVLFGPITGSPMIAPGGTIYLGCNALKFNAVKGASQLAKSSWPCFRGNTKQTGRVAGLTKLQN